jgi:peptidoglycan/LPS O-acetylase OafA/YrhL
MDELNPLFVLPVLLIALVTIYLVSRAMKIDAKTHQFSSIDGLRGFLATSVFLHHSALWYHRTHSHGEYITLSNLYTHFGSSSVALFFMITSFLFFSKLIAAYEGRIDWLKLCVSRILRIMPLYGFAMVILFLNVVILSHFVVRESFPDLLKHAGQWLLFMEPDINKVGGTRLIIYGVQWSLAFEWMFYCSLPLLGLFFFKIRTPVLTILLASIFLIVFLVIIFGWYDFRAERGMVQFLGGLPAAFLARNERVRKIASSIWLSFVFILLLCYVLFFYESIFTPLPFLCMTLIFTGIACGNDLFGVLTLKACRLLGQVSYSIYLLHGLVLFTTFNYIIGFNNVTRMSVFTYYGTICVCAVALATVSSFTFNFVERRGIDSAAGITNKLRRIFSRLVIQ